MPKHRLSKITTRTGDAGESGLASGRRLAKSDALFEVMGDVDELNASIGLLMAALSTGGEQHQDRIQSSGESASNSLCAWYELCAHIQQTLFNLGGELAMDGEAQFITEQDVHHLDEWIAEHNATLPELKEFVMPSGSESVARAHLARAIARRAERHLVTLHHSTPQSAYLLAYVNRLSDALFVLARCLGLNEHHEEILWEK